MPISIEDLITAPWRTSVVFTAVRIRLFTVLSDDSLTGSEIASRCGAVPRLLKPLLEACTAMDLLRVNEGKYENSPFSSRYLVEGERRYVGDLVRLQHDESGRWEALHDIIVESGAIREADKARHRTFIMAMHNLGLLGEAEALSEAVDLAGCGRMVDAGGGSGVYSVALCRKYPGLHSTILDRRETLAVTRELMAGRDEGKRITLREADIETAPFGEGIDAVLLSDVIYDEVAAARVLGNARACLKEGGRLIVRGYYADPHGSRPLFGALFVLGQLAFDPGRKVLNISSLRERVREAGFSIVEVSPLTERSFLLIARLPGE